MGAKNASVRTNTTNTALLEAYQYGHHRRARACSSEMSTLWFALQRSGGGSLVFSGQRPGLGVHDPRGDYARIKLRLSGVATKDPPRACFMPPKRYLKPVSTFPPANAISSRRTIDEGPR